MIASAITPRKIAMRPCIITSPLSQALAICPERRVNLVQDLLHALNPVLALAQAVGSTNTIMDQDDCKPSAAPKRQYSYSSESDNGGRIHCPDKSDIVFATFSAPKAKKKRTQK